MTIVKSTFVHATVVHATFVPEIFVLYFKLLQKRDVRAFPAKTSWGTTRPLIGQAAHGRRAGIILLTAWQIRGRVVPHEVLAENALTALFCKTCL